jgi:DNA-binding transcriptional LysR family regulator
MPPTASVLLNRLTTRARIRHMQVLVRLAELRSMRRAAESLSVSQPAVSQLLRELEDLLGVPLFLRHAKGVQPTPLALDLVAPARRIIAAAEDGAEIVAREARRADGHVRVGTTVSAAGGLLSTVLPLFAAAHPAIGVHVGDHLDRELSTGLVDADLDLICCREPAVIPEGWTFARCLDDELVVVCDAGHPLTGRGPVSLDDLARARWLPNAVSSLPRRRFEAFMAETGWPEPESLPVQTRSPMLTWSLLRANRLLTLVPRSVFRPWLGRGFLVALDTALTTPLAPIGHLWRPENAGRATRTFAAFLKDNADADHP